MISNLIEVDIQELPGQPLLLAHPPVDGDGGEVLLNQQLGQGHAALHRLDEDNHLEIGWLKLSDI